MYVGAVLGPGVMALPALGIMIAGPASLLSWAVLLLLSVPVALCFAALGARYPDGGGISSFVSRALGPRAAAVVGWWFYAVVPVGILAGGLVGGHYVAAATGLGDGYVYPVAAILLALAFAANYAGLHVSGRLQLALVGMLASLLLVTVVLALPHMSAARFTPFMPAGMASVGSAMVVLFYAFSGWEAASHLSAEFADPRRHLPRVTWLTLGVVGVLYLALVVTTVGVLGARAGRSAVPMMELLRAGIGDIARPLTALAAVLLSLGALNTFIAGAARLGASLGTVGALPTWFAKETRRGPRRSLTVQALATAAATGIGVVLGLGLDLLMSLTAVFLAAVTFAGMVAAARILRGDRVLGWLAWIGALFSAVVLAFSGVLLLFPVVVGALGAALWRRPRTAASPALSGMRTAGIER